METQSLRKVLVLDDGPGARRLGCLAAAQGIPVVRASREPGFAPGESWLVIGGNAGEQEDWLRRMRLDGAEGRRLEDLRDLLDAASLSFRQSLSPRECLATWGNERRAKALEDYADRPGLLALRIRDRKLVSRLRSALTQGAGTPEPGRLREEWKRAVVTLEQQPGRVRALEDLPLVVAPESIRPLALEAWQAVRRAGHDWWWRGQSLPGSSVLILFHAGEDPPWAGDKGVERLTALEFYNDDLSAELPSARDYDGAGFVWRQGDARPHYRNRLSVDFHLGARPTAQRLAYLDKLLAELLDKHLVWGRPLRHYRCTFFLPLDLESLRHKLAPGTPLQPPSTEPLLHLYPVDKTSPGDGGGADDETNSAQAYWYFMPALRDLLYELKGPEARTLPLEPVREWRLDNATGWRLTLGRDEERGDPLRYQRARVVSVRLWRYFNGLLLLGLSLEPAVLADLPGKPGAAPLFEDSKAWWRILALSPPETWRRVAQLQVNAWLRFTRLARLLYPSFVEQQEEGKIAPLVLREGSDAVLAECNGRAGPIRIPAAPGQDLCAVVCRLLEGFLGERLETSVGHSEKLANLLRHYSEVYDDRMFANVSYGLAGDRTDKESEQRLFAAALMADRREDGWPEFGGYAYDRAWLGPFLDTARLPMWEGLGQYAGYTGATNAYLGWGDYFCRVTAPRHVHYPYERMLIQALFYRASLRHYARRIVADTNLLVGSETVSFKMREEFICFTNQYWFHEVTEQVQGQAIFRLQQQAMDLEREYQFIKDQMERTDEFLEGQFNRRVQRAGTVLGVVGGTLAALATVMAFLTYLKDWGSSADIATALGPVGNSLMSAAVWAAGGTGLVMLLSWFLWRWLKDRPRPAQ